MKKLSKVITILMSLFLIAGCSEKGQGIPNGADDDVGSNLSDYFYEIESEDWEEEIVNQTLQYRQTETLPAAVGTNFLYKVGTRVVDIIVDGDIQDYIKVLANAGFSGVKKMHKLAQYGLGLRDYYGCISPEKTLSAYVYPLENGQYEVEAKAKLPTYIYDEFLLTRFYERFDRLTYFYPDEDPVSQFILVPNGEFFTFNQSGSDYFVVDATVENGNPTEYEKSLTDFGYTKVGDHDFHVGNLGCKLYDIEETIYSLEYYVVTIPQFDYEHFTANYNNGGIYILLFGGREKYYLYFDHGKLYGNPTKQLDLPIDTFRTILSYDREGCKKPTELHVYGPDKARGAINYDFIIDFSFFDNHPVLIEDHSVEEIFGG